MCFQPPEHFSIHHKELIRQAGTIVLAKAVGEITLGADYEEPVAELLFGPSHLRTMPPSMIRKFVSSSLRLPRTKFEVIRTIKGKTKRNLSF